MDKATFTKKRDEILDQLPEEFRGAVSIQAYRDGHAFGYDEVLDYIIDLVDMLKEPIAKYTARIIVEHAEV